MAEFNIESTIKKGVEAAINKPVYGGKSITEWAAIGMKAPQWISIKDRLPEKSGYFLVYKNNGYMAVATFQSRGKRTHWGKGNCKITHWMPLPEPPEEETDEQE